MRNLYRIFFFSFLFLFYRYFSFSKVPFGDALGFVNLAEINQFTDDTTVFGKFLYTNFLVGFKQIFSLDSIPAVRYFNLIFSILTLAVIFSIIKLKFKEEIYAYIGTLILAFSFTFWKQTEIIEVYTFNSFWIALYTYFSLQFLESKKHIHLFWSSLILGLSFWAHVQNIMLIPGWLVLNFYAYKKFKVNILSSLLIFSFFAFGLYLLASINGYDASKVYGSGNSDWVTGSINKGVYGFAMDIAVAIGYLIYNFWFFTIPGVLVIFKKLKTIKNFKNQYYLISFLAPFGFATIYNVSDNYVFFLNSYLYFLLFIMEGLIIIRNHKPRLYKNISLSVLFTPFFYVLSFFVISKTPPGQNFEKDKSYKGGLSYYLFPWMNNNIGVLEYYLGDKTPTDTSDFMYNNCQEFLKLRKAKNSLEEIKNF
ncbi:protein O-mannosyl-transferase family [Epilithonimonas arachidiradicis]|uniref:Uncharacterized protein DUF2723 n=1 Tax=Epilithonimonas arachidiradicis TaxID=1617282 RepID=A0A420D8C6_9FLAO|nr:DUF2723 domain-containing protein [Epilithonimonas arachidiradicis]RKE86785.1 uncharacterized protein DUF2723 [Epilithonimonas arachidiradicis]GGG62009.1 hypothetical protein GCM10007332_24990 [Epilithonimonas arachidiradicis]